MPLLMEQVSDCNWEWLAHLVDRSICNTKVIVNASSSQKFIVIQKLIQFTIKSVSN